MLRQYFVQQRPDLLQDKLQTLLRVRRENMLRPDVMRPRTDLLQQHHLLWAESSLQERTLPSIERRVDKNLPVL